jgi:DNA-directed RNA polymerase subunit RPC12/RpoP
MSKHNNNLSPSSSKKCNCGRYITLGEEHAKIGIVGTYECPDCSHRRYAKPLTREEYYEQFARV